MKPQKIANLKSKIKNPSTRLANLARAHEQAEVAFQLSQAAREFERAARLERGARARVFAFAQERFERGPVAAGARGDALGYALGRGRGRHPAVASERAARARVDVFEREVVGARALLNLRHRGDELKLRAAVNARRGQCAREATPARPYERERDERALREEPDDGRAAEVRERFVAAAAVALMELVEEDAPAPARDEVDGEEEVVGAVYPRVRDDVRVAQHGHAAAAVRVIDEHRAVARPTVVQVRDGRGRV